MKKEFIAAVFGLILISISAYFTWNFVNTNFSGNVVLDENAQYKLGLLGIDGRYSSKIFLERGEERGVQIEFVNSGEKGLDDCFISSDDNYEFIKSGDMGKDIGIGKNVKFIVEFDIPLDFDSIKINSVNLSLICEEFRKSYSFPLIIKNPDIAFEIESYNVSNGKLIFYYNLDRSYFSSDVAFVNYKLVDIDGKEVLKGEKVIDITQNKIEVDIPVALSGEFDLIIELEGKDSSGEDRIRVLISSTKITGFAVLGEGDEIYPYFIVAIIIVIIFILSIKFLHSHSYRSRKAHHSFNREISRKYIKLDIN